MMGASDAIEGIAIHCDDIIVHEMNAVASADSICFVGWLCKIIDGDDEQEL